MSRRCHSSRPTRTPSSRGCCGGTSLPESMRAAAPARIRPTEEGAWEMAKHEQTSETQAQKDRAEEMARVQTNDLTHRFQVMHEDKIDGEIVFPTIGLYIWDLEDAELGAACCQIYNDWIYDVIESKSDRHRCAGLIPTWNIDHAVAEVGRIKELGLATAMLPVHGVPYEYNHRVLGTALGRDRGDRPAGLDAPGHRARHALLSRPGCGRLEPAGDPVARTAYRQPARDVGRARTAPRVALRLRRDERVLDRLVHGHHRLLLRLVPGVPELGQAAAQREAQHYLTRQVHGTFQWDPSAINNISHTGVPALMWGSDYPHAEGTYPHSRKIAQELCGDLPEDEARAILGGTAIDLFGFDRAAVSTPVPAPAAAE